MKRRYKDFIPLIATVCSVLQISHVGWTQELSSFYFTEPQPKDAAFVTVIPTQWRGHYRHATDTVKHLHADRDSVYTLTPVPVLVPVTLGIENGYVFLDSLVVTTHDTLPCWIHDDTAYFYLYIPTIIIHAGMQQIAPMGDNWLVSTPEENGLWSVFLITHYENAIEIAYFDHSKQEAWIKKRKKIIRVTDENQILYKASFKTKEWKKMMMADWFPYRTRFNKAD